MIIHHSPAGSDSRSGALSRARVEAGAPRGSVRLLCAQGPLRRAQVERSRGMGPSQPGGDAAAAFVPRELGTALTGTARTLEGTARRVPFRPFLLQLSLYLVVAVAVEPLRALSTPRISDIAREMQV